MGGQGKLALSLLLAVVLAVLVSACGGSGDTTSAPPTGAGAATTTESTTGGETKAKAASDAGDRKSKPPGKGGGETSEEPESGAGAGKGGEDGSGGSGGAGTGGEEPSAEFRTPSGDNSVQTYGEEGSDADREAASAALETYMSARAEHDWAKACEQLAASAVNPLEKIVARGGGCVATFTEVAKRVPASAWSNPMTGPISSLRVEGGRGFALFHGREGADYLMQMSTEAGAWRVAALEPTVLP